MNIELRPIRTEEDYRRALKMVEMVFDAGHEPEPDSEEAASFEALVTLLEAYERKHYPIEAPTPAEAIKFHMEQQGLSVSDMERYIGSKNRVYEVLKGSRPLSLNMIRRLMTLGIPAESLLGSAQLR
ncbi:MAG: transcriptional regulator [Comamonas sp.]|nr:transcriptional regulator [Comamonas sp.]